MAKNYYKCTFLSDIVLNSGTATEGHSTSLDYIPGSKFLGIVARNYDDFAEEDAYKVFHSAEVVFSDAHLALDNKRSYKIPYSWYQEKGVDDFSEIFIHHKHNYSNDDTQLKQIRAGFFIPGDKYTFIKPEHFFSLKSAYDMDSRTSKEGQMFGYDAIKKGSEWIFSVSSNNDELLTKIDKIIVTGTRLGRSKSAEYGKVKIEKIDDSPEVKSKSGENGATLIYFDSCAVFYDENNNPTLSPTAKNLGFNNAKINYEKSQIRTRYYAPWNGKRKGRDIDRLCIDKGSVLYVENVDNSTISDFINSSLNGVGYYRNEGFGKIIINPEFLTANKIEFTNPDFKEKIISKEHYLKKSASDEMVLKWISVQKNKDKQRHLVFHKVSEIIQNNEFKVISASQWGAIRSRVQRIIDYDEIITELFAEETGFLRHGKSVNIWRNKWERLKNHSNSVVRESSKDFGRLFLIKLATEMGKIPKKSRGES